MKRLLDRNHLPFLGMIVAAFCLLMLVSACKKDEVFNDPTPQISLVSVSPSTVIALDDSILFKVYYQDGDGDLGENDPDVENLFIEDTRTNAAEGFRIQQLAPDNSNVQIAGTLNVVLPNTGITDGSTSQNVTFNVWVIDRAGNMSNIVTSEAVTVVE